MDEPPKKLSLEFFDQRLIDLHTEVRNHPRLMVILHEQPDKDVYIQLMEIATYCDLFVTGTYTKEDILQLSEKMTTKLRGMRTSIIIIPPQDIAH